MRIAHVNSERGWGGGEAQTCHLISGLQARGLENTLIARTGSQLAERAREAGTEVIEVPMRGEWDLPAAMKLAAILRRRKPDILHLHTSRAHALGLLAAGLAGIEPVVVTRRMDLEIRGFLSKWKYRHVDHVVAISQVIRGLLVKGGVPPERISVIYSAVDFPLSDAQDNLRTELGLQGHGPVIGTVATLCENKGHRFLFDAVVSLKSRFPHLRLLVAGTGPMESPLRELARTQGLEHEIIFLGFRKDIPRVLNTLDVFVLASRKEGLGVSVLEAARAGLPIVATNVGGIPEIVRDGDTGCLVPPADSAALAEKIAYVLDHPAEAADLGRRARDLIRREFSLDGMAARYHSLYDSLIQQRDRAA